VTAILLAGLPPLSGFLGKFLLLKAAMVHPAWVWILTLVLVGGLLGMIALARSGSLLFFRTLPPPEGSEHSAPPPAASLVSLWPVLGLLGLTLGMTVAAGPLHQLASATAEQLLQPYLYVHAVLGGRS
jgi:multicomponent K+:H+ antiporter subunit D